VEDLCLAGKMTLKEPYSAGRVLCSTGSVLKGLHNIRKIGAIRTFENTNRNTSKVRKERGGGGDTHISS
jgi:hypothetical protein